MKTLQETISVKKYIVYYGLLTALSILMMRPEVEYPMVVRLFYTALVFVPLLSAKYFTPFAVTAFYTISYCSFTGLMPFSIIYPLVALLIIWFTHKERLRIPILFITSLSYFLLISTLHYDYEQTGWMFGGILMTVLLSSYIKDKSNLSIFAYGFVVITFVLSIAFLLNREHFMYSYFYNSELINRSGWMNPNDMGGTIACGTVIATGLSLNGERKIKFLRIFLYVTICLSILALAFNASRGALSASAIGCSLLILLSNKISLYSRICIIVVIALFIFILFNNDVFELVTSRFKQEADEESGGGRFGIWESKMRVFGNYDSIDQMFGVGQLECKTIGRNIRTHNDFVTAIIAYGFVGLALFICMLLYPFLNNFSIKKNLRVLPYMAFLLTECVVLEPLFRGYFVFIAYYMFVCKLSSLTEK